MPFSRNFSSCFFFNKNYRVCISKSISKSDTLSYASTSGGDIITSIYPFALSHAPQMRQLSRLFELFLVANLVALANHEHRTGRPRNTSARWRVRIVTFFCLLFVEDPNGRSALYKPDVLWNLVEGLPGGRRWAGIVPA